MTAVLTMAKGAAKSEGGEKPVYGSGSIKIDPELAWKAKFIANFRSVSIAEYLDPLIREQIETDFATVTAAAGRVVKGG